jgi:hypothetical protein
MASLDTGARLDGVRVLVVDDSAAVLGVVTVPTPGRSTARACCAQGSSATSRSPWASTIWSTSWRPWR